MGAASSTDVNFDDPPPPGYDFWGYQPSNLQPSQHQWSELYTKGMPPAKGAFTTQNLTQLNPRAAPYPYGILGQGADRMQTFGASTQNDLDDGGTFYYGTKNMGNYGAVQFPNSNTARWPLDGANVNNVCTPQNYPNCDMQEWAKGNNKQFTPWQNYFGQIAEVTISNDKSESNEFIQSTLEPKPYDNIGEWQQAINRIADNYGANGLSALDAVNTKNTQLWDPCGEVGFFGKAVPIACAIAAVAAPNVLLFEFTKVLPADVIGVADLSLVSIGYDLGKATMLKSNVFGGDTKGARRFQEKAARVICLGGGYVLTREGLPWILTEANVNLSDPLLMAAGVAGGALAYSLLYDTVSTGVVVGGLGLGVFGAVLNFFDSIQRFFCHLSHWGEQACDDHSQETGFPDARKWDAGSVAAKLTDIACTEQGWTRDDPRAQFVLRGLLTGPSLSWAASEDGVGPGLYPAWHMNPLGSWLQTHTKITQSNLGFQEFTNTWNNQLTSITGGNTSETNWGSNADHNRYACNNWDVIMAAAENTSGGGDGKESAGQIQSDIALARNLRKWLDELVIKAQDPNNLRAQNEIPGLEKAQLPNNSEYDEQTYLATCTSDYNRKTGTGFNSVRQRGMFAGNYDIPDITDLETAQDATLLANWFFAYDNESAAYDAATRFTIEPVNLTQLVHYWHQEKGSAQQFDFFNKWERRDDPRIANELARIATGWHFPFTATGNGPIGVIPPWQKLPKVLDPLSPSTGLEPVNTMRHLQGGDSADLQELFDGISQAWSVLWSNNPSMTYCSVNMLAPVQQLLTAAKYDPKRYPYGTQKMFGEIGWINFNYWILQLAINAEPNWDMGFEYVVADINDFTQRPCPFISQVPAVFLNSSNQETLSKLILQYNC